MERKILLVDDEADIREILGLSLGDLGYEVSTAENGEEALRIFRVERPAVVLSDIKMPVMGGIELLKQIKAESPETEVIMITGHGDMDSAILSLRHEATDFITKPINEEMLEIALGRALERRFMRQQLREYTENLESMVKRQSARLVEAERQLAVNQAVDGLTTAIQEIASGMDGGIRYFNEMPTFVAIHNRNLDIVAANALFQERLCAKVGDPSWTIYETKGDDPEACPVRETLARKKGLRSRESLKCASGAKIPAIVHTAPIRSHEGEVALVLEIATDVSEVKRLREALRESQQRFEVLFEEVPCYISVRDREFRLTAANRLFKEDFDHEIGSLCYSAYRDRKGPCDNCPVIKTFSDGQTHQAEMIVRGKTGEQIPILVWTAPIRDADGQVDQVMLMGTNIAQIRNLEDHLSNLGLMIGSISHGIKGLLTGLDSGMYLLDTGFSKADDEQIAEGWEVVKMTVDRIKNVVLDILFYARERDLKWERINVLDFAKDVAFVAKTKIGQEGIRFVQELDDVLGEFEIDPGVIHSALISILNNAIEACLDDTEKDSHQIVFGVCCQGEDIVFRISDNGIGMARKIRENLFNLFFTQKGHRGTGLGLFLSNQIVRQHGGSIQVDSAPGEGSTFTVRIPKSLPETAKTRQEPSGLERLECT